MAAIFDEDTVYLTTEIPTLIMYGVNLDIDCRNNLKFELAKRKYLFDPPDTNFKIFYSMLKFKEEINIQNTTYTYKITLFL